MTARGARRSDLTGDEARALLARAEHVHLAAAARHDEPPTARTVHGAVCGGRLYLHGSRRGSVAAMVARPVVAWAVEQLAIVPSWVRDERQPCRATTLFESVQARGVLAAVDDPREKAAALTALMTRHQPEGRHAPLDPADATMARAIEATGVFALDLGDLTSRSKVGQGWPDETRDAVLEHLWWRGRGRDLEALARMLGRAPDRRRPGRFDGPGGTRLDPAPGANAVAGVASLLAAARSRVPRGTDDLDAAATARAHLSSAAWIVARDPARGEVVGTVRALSDGSAFAWILDLAVAAEAHGSGLAAALVALALDHPAVRRARMVWADPGAELDALRAAGFGPPSAPGGATLALFRPQPGGAL